MLAATARGEMIDIEIRSGGEISTDLMSRMFEPFTTAMPSKSGLGLGLYIVRQIVKAHGGSGGAHSAAGITTVTLSLPRTSTDCAVPQK